LRIKSPCGQPIDIDDALMRKAMRLSGLTMNKAVVEAALPLLIQTHSQAGIRRLRGKVNGKGIQTTLVADVRKHPANPVILSGAL
jgi:Arc/MetJ family transcription regulator